MNHHGSIYQNILTAKEENPNTPYSFQDLQIAGREDTLFILLTEGVPFSKKEDLSCECCVLIEKTLEDKTDFKNGSKISEFLKENPMRLFFIEFRERLRVLIEHHTFNHQLLYTFAMELIRKSDDPEEVKLGIIILGFFPNDLTQQIFKTLGYHSDYTIYVAESLHHSEFQQNHFIYDLVQNTDGYGKLAALFLLRPITEEQKEWVVKEGIKSSFLSNIYSSLSFQKTDIREYIFYTEITSKNYRDFMYFIAYCEKNEQETLSGDMLTFLEKMIDKRELATTFIDQAGMIMMWHWIMDTWKQDYQELDEETDETKELSEYWENRFKRYEELIRSIEVFLNKPKWEQVVKKELANPKESDYLIATVLQFMEVVPEMNAFIPILKRNPLGLHLLDFFLINHPNNYFTEVCIYLKQLLNEELFTIPFEFEEEDIPETHNLFRVNIWLQTLFELMIERDLYDEEWLSHGLKYYHPKVRRLSLQSLKKHREKWSNTMFNEIEYLEKKEKNNKNCNLLRLLLNPDVQIEKERRFMKLIKPVTKVSPWDRKLLDSYLAGSHDHDLSVIDDLLKKGSILQLVRDQGNEFDKHAVAVTMENGYLLGYIPRVDNRVLANLLDNKDTLYAVMVSEDIYEIDPYITIMLKERSGKAIPKDNFSKKNIVQFPQKK